MTNEQIVSWIFLATALASGTVPADFSSISTIADGINHAVPTQKELQTSMTWLTNNGLVKKSGNKYSLTLKGKSDYDEASKRTSVILSIWDNLEYILRKYRA
jgi:predicted transcriptional regulator